MCVYVHLSCLYYHSQHIHNIIGPYKMKKIIDCWTGFPKHITSGLVSNIEGMGSKAETKPKNGSQFRAHTLKAVDTTWMSWVMCNDSQSYTKIEMLHSFILILIYIYIYMYMLFSII